jgi:uncharacterized protein YbcV (DUF1398 family)
MNATLVCHLAQATLSGAMPFPAIVGQLIEEGVEYYHVDYIRLQFTFYDTAGGVVVAPLTFESLPTVASSFNGPALRSAILDSQQNNQKFSQFCKRAMEAGVQGYYAFLRGQRVTYLGRNGDHHVEWFPGAGPGDA